MIKRTTLACICAMIIGVPASAQDERATPVRDFLTAADNGDWESMVTAMNPKRGISSKKLKRKLEGCYLRAVYSGPLSEIIAAWMCAEGEEKSRVILAEVVSSDVGAIVEIAMEKKNNVPAPPRTGSAFGDGP